MVSSKVWDRFLDLQAWFSDPFTSGCSFRMACVTCSLEGVSVRTSRTVLHRLSVGGSAPVRKPADTSNSAGGAAWTSQQCRVIRSMSNDASLNMSIWAFPGLAWHGCFQGQRPQGCCIFMPSWTRERSNASRCPVESREKSKAFLPEKKTKIYSLLRPTFGPARSVGYRFPGHIWHGQ